jgi:hypothetical protein
MRTSLYLLLLREPDIAVTGACNNSVMTAVLPSESLLYASILRAFDAGCGVWRTDVSAAVYVSVSPAKVMRVS